MVHYYYVLLVACALFMIATRCDGGCSNGGGTCANQFSRSSCNRRYRCDWYSSCIFDPCRTECRYNFQSCSAISSDSLCLSYSDCYWTPDPPPPSSPEPEPPSPPPTTPPPTTPRPTRSPAPTASPKPWVKREDVFKSVAWFGASMSVDNDTVLVAADTGFFEYQRDETGIWLESFTATDFFWSGLAHHGDTAVLGDSIGGRVYIYSREGVNGGWSEQTVLENTDNTSSSIDWFGEDAAIDDSTIVIGDPLEGVGAVYIYSRSADKFLLVARLLPSPSFRNVHRFGASVDISGNFVVVGARGSRDNSYKGHAIVFERINGEWDDGFLLQPNGEVENSLEWFGSYVAIHGSTIVVGSETSSFVFERSGTGNEWTHTQTLGPGRKCVAITENFMLVDERMYQWSISDGTWIFQQQMELEETSIDVWAISGNIAIVAANVDASGGAIALFEYVGDADSEAMTNESTTLAPSILVPAETPAPSEKTPGPTSTTSNSSPSPTTSPPSGNTDSTATPNESKTPEPSTPASSSPLPTTSPPSTSASPVVNLEIVYPSFTLFVMLIFHFW